MPFGPLAAGAGNLAPGWLGNFIEGSGRGTRRGVGPLGVPLAGEAGSVIAGLAMGRMPDPSPGGAFGVIDGAGVTGVSAAGRTDDAPASAGAFGNGEKGLLGNEVGAGNLAGAVAGSATGASELAGTAGADGAGTGAGTVVSTGAKGATAAAAGVLSKGAKGRIGEPGGFAGAVGDSAAGSGVGAGFAAGTSTRISSIGLEICAASAAAAALGCMAISSTPPALARRSVISRCTPS